MKRSNKILLFLLIVAVAGLIAWSFAPRAVVVQTAEVKRGSFTQVVEEDGKTRVRERYVISAPLAGKVNRLLLKAGDSVANDQVVARIAPNMSALLDTRSVQELTERIGAAEAVKARALADVARSQATLDKSQADLRRVKQLASSGFVAAAQVEQAEMEREVNVRSLEAARQSQHVAEHELATARAALQHTRTGGAPDSQWAVRTPVAGSVLKVLQESENVVALGAPLLEIGNPQDMEIVADVLSSDAVQIRPGAPVQIEHWGRAETLQGRVRLVEPSAYTKVSALGVEEQRVNIVIDITAPPAQWQGLSDGYKVDVRIVVFVAEDALKVPVSALFRKDDGWAVFVASGGRAVQRMVRVARRSGLDAMVESGLQPGEQVIVYPGDAVKDGQRIRPAH